MKGNPAHVSYVAKLPESGDIKGDISATAGPGGVGTNFVVNFSDLPASQGPFCKSNPHLPSASIH